MNFVAEISCKMLYFEQLCTPASKASFVGTQTECSCSRTLADPVMRDLVPRSCVSPCCAPCGGTAGPRWRWSTAAAATPPAVGSAGSEPLQCWMFILQTFCSTLAARTESCDECFCWVSLQADKKCKHPVFATTLSCILIKVSIRLSVNPDAQSQDSQTNLRLYYILQST